MDSAEDHMSIQPCQELQRTLELLQARKLRWETLLSEAEDFVQEVLIVRELKEIKKDISKVKAQISNE